MPTMVKKIPEGYSSGQRGQTVNLLAQPSEVRILPPPPDNLCVAFGSTGLAGIVQW